jgi:hypothetical protein
MQSKLEIQKEFIAHLKILSPASDPIAWVKNQHINPSILNEIFFNAISSRQLEIVKILAKVDEVDPTSNDNYAIRKAAYNGHLEIVKFLNTLPGVDPTANNHEALRLAIKMKEKDVVTYLASLPCYNPYDPNITVTQKNALLRLLTDLKLPEYISKHRINANRNLGFLFFKDPESTFNTHLINDVKSLIVDNGVNLDNRGITVF